MTSYVYDSNGARPADGFQRNPAGASVDPDGQNGGQDRLLHVQPAARAVNCYRCIRPNDHLRSYYANGQIHTVTNAKNEVTTYAYDSNGYLQSITGPVSGAVTLFGYDAFGRLRTTTDSEGYAITIDYDAIGGDPTKTMDRIAKITYPDGTY